MPASLIAPHLSRAPARKSSGSPQSARSSSVSSIPDRPARRVSGTSGAGNTKAGNRADSPASSTGGRTGSGLPHSNSQRSLLRPSTADRPSRDGSPGFNSQLLMPAGAMQASLEARRGSAVPSVVRTSVDFTPQSTWNAAFSVSGSATSSAAYSQRRSLSQDASPQFDPHPGQMVNRVFSNSRGIGGNMVLTPSPGDRAGAASRSVAAQPAVGPTRRHRFFPQGSARERLLKALGGRKT